MQRSIKPIVAKISARDAFRCAMTAAIGLVSPLLSSPLYAMPVQRISASISAVSASFVYPLLGPRESSDYGLRKHPVLKKRQHHDGVDLAAPKGAPIRSIASGQIVFADPFGGYGNLIVIKHASGLTSHYGHCDKLRVKTGQTVKAGDLIATVGSTGRSTGPHLHFEIRRDGKPVHPERYLPGLDEPANG